MDKHIERVFKKNSLKPDAASHNNISRYTDTEWFLEHTSSGGSLSYSGLSLQKIILGFRVPLICETNRLSLIHI